jgi:natural product precursor
MKKLKLNALANNALSERESENIKGGAGCSCGCSCVAHPSVGSSSSDNGCASSTRALFFPSRYTDLIF